MNIEIEEKDPGFLPTGRPRIHFHRLVNCRNLPLTGPNAGICIELASPEDKNRSILINEMKRILPFMYRPVEDAIRIITRYIDQPSAIMKQFPLPPSSDYQLAHIGEFLFCVYFEELENKIIPCYKWRLNTTENQHQYGMDILAFNFEREPPEIYLIAVKATEQGENNRTPSQVNKAISELKGYLDSDRLDDDLGVISANLHTNTQQRNLFMNWYEPYTRGYSNTHPTLVAVPAIVAEANVWQDKYARIALRSNFVSTDHTCSGAVRVVCIRNLRQLVDAVYAPSI